MQPAVWRQRSFVEMQRGTHSGDILLCFGDQIFEAFTVGATLRLAFFIVLLGSAPLIVVAAKKIGELEYVADGAWGVYLA